MDDTRSMTRARRLSARIPVVLCLLLAVGVLPVAAFAAPKTVSDVEATYLNTATIGLMATGSIDDTYYTMDGGAKVEGVSATTSLYGAHVLKFWSEDTSGVVEAEVTAPFFVDDSVVPAVEFEIEELTATAAELELTATDNFNGSGVDFLCYRVDGGKIVTAIAPAAAQATKLLMARIADVKVSGITAASVVDPNGNVPHGDRGACAACHEIVVPTPDPTTTPVPTGTPAPQGGVSSDIGVTGAGSHTIEYWAQDIARNETAHVTKTFTIAGAVVTKTPTHLTLSISKNRAKRGVGYVLSGEIDPEFAGAPIVISYRRPGERTWRRWTTVTTNAAGAYRVGTRGYRLGTYMYRATFSGDATHGVARYVYDSIRIVR